MRVAPIPADEAARLRAVRATGILDTPEEERFDRLTRLAADYFHVPISAVTLLDADRQWFKSCVGFDSRQVPRASSFCAHAVLGDQPLVVEDALADERFADSPTVVGEPYVRFYAGHPLHSIDGFRIGTLCVIDSEPRQLDAVQLDHLRDLAGIAERELNHIEVSQALERLSASERRLLAVMESVADGILAFGADLVIVSANPAAERVFRAEPGTLVGRGVDELIEGMELDEIRGHLGAAAAGSSETVIGRRVEVTARRDDGERFPLELTVSETRVGGERMFVGAGSDLSASHAAALALRQSERRFRAIFESAAIGIGLMHVQGVLVDANAALAEMLRRPLEEIRGASLPALLALDTDPEIRALLRDLAAGRRVQGRRELQYMAADGTTLWASLAVSVLQEDSGRPARFAIVLLEDITARHESERLKDEFVSAVSHELRTPLTSIRGSLGLLTGGMMGALPPDAASLLGVAAENAERLVRLVNDILDIERLGSGRMALEIETISGARLLEDAGDVVRATADEAGVTLELAEDDGVVVHADPHRVVQTLANLLSNAIKFSPRGSRVHAEVRRDAGLALFTVRDEGRGIPADQFEVVFERFRQLDGSDSREKGGTGLGLAIARTIVEQHGGRIWVESTEGEGATFHFTLPADGAAA